MVCTGACTIDGNQSPCSDVGGNRAGCYRKYAFFDLPHCRLTMHVQFSVSNAQHFKII